MLNLFGLDASSLQAVLAERGQPAYRARQLYAWLYARHARAFDVMSDLGRELRAQLAETCELRWPSVAERRRSSDGTLKYLFKLDDGATIESVFIPEARRRTICVSTQAGCPLACVFCLTGIGGYRRNLKPWEIVGQVSVIQAEAAEAGPDERPWNVVFMGMGEPLLNVEATLAALRLLLDPQGFALAPRRVTLSTVGILPALERLAQEPVRPNLAVSLHASNPTLRRTLMPIEAKYALDDVLAAARRYAPPSGGRVTFEYVLLRGVNDTRAHASELARLLRGFPGKVNLIPLNPAPEVPFEAPDPAAVSAFCAVLAEARVTVSVRRARGQDVFAACGQLHFQREAPALAVRAS